jgi:hypothetical protein
MSFYDISTNPQDFEVSNPATVVKGQINLLNNQFHLSPVTSIAATTGYAYSAYEVLNGGFISRTGAVTGGCTDTFPTAAAIVAAARNRITALAGLAGGRSDVNGVVDNYTVSAEGFSADLVISNRTSGTLTLAANTGLTIVNGETIATLNAKLMRVIITNASSGAEAVCIDML